MSAVDVKADGMQRQSSGTGLAETGRFSRMGLPRKNLMCLGGPDRSARLVSTNGSLVIDRQKGIPALTKTRSWKSGAKVA